MFSDNGQTPPKTTSIGDNPLNIEDPTLIRILHEINLAEKLMLKYLNEISPDIQSDNVASNEMALLVLKEVDYLREIKRSRILESCEGFAKLTNGVETFVITVIPDDEAEKIFEGKDKDGVKKFPSDISVYYDAEYELPEETSTSPSKSNLSKSIFEMLNTIFELTLKKFENENL